MVGVIEAVEDMYKLKALEQNVRSLGSCDWYTVATHMLWCGHIRNVNSKPFSKDIVLIGNRSGLDVKTWRGSSEGINACCIRRVEMVISRSLGGQRM